MKTLIDAVFSRSPCKNSMNIR